MTHQEIRRRALRAAAAVSLTMGIFGCATQVELATGADDGAGGGGGEGGEGGATVASTTTSATTATTATGDPPVADAGSDAAVDCNQAADYLACCQEHDWDWNAGCMAWGPPMPPSLEVA